MDQISRPLLIALVAVVGFAGAWMTVLRPQASGGGERATAAPAARASGPSAAAPGVGGLRRAVDRARGAEAASAANDAAVKKASAAVEDPAPKADAAPAPAPVAKPAAVKPVPAAKPAKPARPAAPAKPVLKLRPAAPAARTVLLFAGSGADDAVARDVVRSVHRPGVRVIVASLGEVHKYADLVGSVSIVASPTILVIGSDRKAQRIDGLPDLAQVEQALDAAR